ncbi:RhaT Permeases of the drug/metabolite transporter (DMT) superfamily [Rhabdaerophilaceae bacterium]
MALRDIVLALILAGLWGSTFTAMKIGVAEVSPLLINALRFGLSAFPALMFVRRPAVPLWTIIAFGLVLGVCKFTALFTALKWGMPAGLASIILQMQVFFTIGLAFVVLGERVGVFQLCGGAIALIGLALFAFDKAENASLLPFFVCLLAAALWGVANMVVKTARTKDIFGFVVWSSAVAGPVLFVLSLLVDGPGTVWSVLANPSWSTILVTLYLSLGATLFGYSVWNSLLSRYPVSLVGPFALLIPVSGMICGALFLGETLSGRAILASVIVFAGLVVNVFGDTIARRIRPTA